MSKRKKDEAWIEAKKRCRLNEADIQMAKQLGMTPKSLIKNIPTKDQKWKAPVKLWVRDLYEEKFGKVLTITPTSKQIKEEAKIPEDWDDLPF
ncbi:hypothetical protein [Litchfieldia alkalitelluris]|uniref:hypothetical protein n=1 Tax=Litchfieldia alkalitelluris TaxID=304268 RepID=UPI001F1AD459|nr:hypothetical protein [Litchfieldia alkalitelluris]